MNKLVGAFLNRFSSLSQDIKDDAELLFAPSNDFRKALVEAANEGIVLLENRNKALPLQNDHIAVFGRGQIDYYYGGNGSGGDVVPFQKVSLINALEEKKITYDKTLYRAYKEYGEKHPNIKGAWGFWPYMRKEMLLSTEMVKEASLKSEDAIIIISRNSGEDQDQDISRGSWYLSSIEKRNINLVCQYFSKVIIVINSSSLIDISYLKRSKVDAILLAYQGGQESGYGLCNILFGECSPSAKLVDTVALIGDYPSTSSFLKKRNINYQESIYVGYRYFNTFQKDKIIYPFGYGLSYTKFSLLDAKFDRLNERSKVSFKVKNTGNYNGKEVVQIYVHKNINNVATPKLELVGFKKTKELQIRECVSLSIEIKDIDLALFDENDSCYKVAKGIYTFYIGFDSLNVNKIADIEIEKEIVLYDYRGVLNADKNMKIIGKDGKLTRYNSHIINKKEEIINALPPELKTDKKWQFSDILSGNCSVNDFVASLSIDDLEHLTRGSDDGMGSPLGSKGNAAVIGGVSDNLIKLGVPSISLNDGPSGVRCGYRTSLVPSGISLASSFNLELIEKITHFMGEELTKIESTYLLAPGINIHRNPLGGRNFEYFSEDPFLTGKIAISYINGLQSNKGIKAVIKHFACNNQETGRRTANSRVDSKALYEIYLKPFEMALREANPGGVMDGYNKINGEFTYYSYELNNVILRVKWHYQGIIMTDWWIKKGSIKEFKNIKTQAARIRSGVDLFMPGTHKRGKGNNGSDGTLLKSYNSKDGITLGEIQRSAAYVIQNIINIIKEK